MKQFKYNKLLLAGGALAVSLTLAGCSVKGEVGHFAHREAVYQAHKGLRHALSAKNVNEQIGKPTHQSDSDLQLAQIQFNIKDYPENVMNLGKSTITPALAKKAQARDNDKSWFKLSPLDNLGRSGMAQALITSESVTTTAEMQRPQFAKSAVPSGYKGNNTEVQIPGYKGYFYNKSHSIAWSLAGADGGSATKGNPVMSRANLTTGTRAQNVGNNGRNKDHMAGGMAYGETIIRDYLKKNPNKSVYYVVTPVYVGNELVPRGSHVQAYSVEDNGKAINLNLWVFNAQDGATINYKTGAFTLNK